MDNFSTKYIVHREIEEDPHKYGLPELKKYPMPDAKHVRSAIKFFNYVDPKHEEELAKAIIKRMKEYGLTFDDFTVGEENKFSKYVPEKALVHHGILGMRWGIRRYQNKDGSLTALGKRRLNNKDVGEIAEELSNASVNKDSKKAVNAVADLYNNNQIRNTFNDSSSELVKAYRDRNEAANEYFKKWDETYRIYSDKDLYDKYSEKLKNEQPNTYKNTKGSAMFAESIRELYFKDSCPQEVRERYKETKNNYDKLCENITNKLVGSYSDVVINTKYKNESFNSIVNSLVDGMTKQYDEDGALAVLPTYNDMKTASFLKSIKYL